MNNAFAVLAAVLCSTAMLLPSSGCYVSNQEVKYSINGAVPVGTAISITIRPNEQIIALNPPKHYPQLRGNSRIKLRLGTALLPAQASSIFVTRHAELEQHLASLTKLDDAGILWVSWPKKAAKVATDVTEDTLREVPLPLGFVDVKVCGVDETWSGLKMMVRRTNRKSSP